MEVRQGSRRPCFGQNRPNHWLGCGFEAEEAGLFADISAVGFALVRARSEGNQDASHVWIVELQGSRYGDEMGIHEVEGRPSERVCEAPS